MKKIILLFILVYSISGFAQNFDKSWDKVIYLENEGKIKSAYKEVEFIYDKAYSNKNEVQIIKCFFYKSKFMMSLEEDAQNKIITNLQNEITKASLPSKAILNLIYAKCLKTYAYENSYKLNQRIKLNSSATGNFLTWTLKDLKEKYEEIYAKILTDEDVLKNTSLKKYDALFDFFNVEDFNNTSLYDYLLWENIEYYTSQCSEWEEYTHKKHDFLDALLSTNEQFKKKSFDSIKNYAHKKVIDLYKKANYSNKSSNLELDRLLFCNKYIVKKNDLLLNKLNALEKRTNDSLLIQKIQFEKASIYEKLASKDTYPNYKIKCNAILDSILSISNRSNSFKKSFEMKNRIVARDLQVEMLQYCYEKENTRASVQYKNIDSIKLSFYKIPSRKLNLESRNDSIIKDLEARKKLYIGQKYILKNNHDFFQYSTEIILPQLEIGTYLVYIEDLESDNTMKRNEFKYLTVTNTGVLSFQKKDEIFYQTLNRKTGKPIPNCIIKNDFFNIITNEKGIAKYKIDTTNKKFNYYTNTTFIQNNDTLISENNYANGINEFDEEKGTTINAKVIFYLDRAIYRPGQTVYYKGIATQIKQSKSSIIPNFLVKINVEDANSNEINSFEVTTNEFGSFTGEFVIPKNSLTGRFSFEAEEPDDYKKDALYNKNNDEHPIWDLGYFEDSRIQFKVEEYKRPKFEITFKPNYDDILINQNVKITGNAKAYMGNNISDAKVVYRIIRVLGYNKLTHHYDENETISTSETKTDASGNFAIDFNAKSSDDIDPNSLPVYTYQVNVNVTDINGETHSAQTTVKAGYHTLVLNTQLPPTITTDNKNTLFINSYNLNNQFVAIDGEIKIYFIKEFQNKFKPRTFRKPELTTISEEDFNNLFPFEINNKEISETETGVIVYSKKINTSKTKSIDLDFISDYKSGYYKITFSATDKFNHPIENNSIFELLQSKEKKATGNRLLTLQQSNKNPLKDGYVKILIKSAIPELYANCIGFYEDKLFFENDITITNNQTEITIPIKKDWTHSFKIGIETMLENQYFRFDIEIVIEEITPNLKIDVASFRDKLEPGKPENWSFKITEDNQRIESEVLASMYDSSLDQFSKQEWKSLKREEGFQNYLDWKSQLCYENIHFSLNNLKHLFYESDFKKETTQLIWFGFDFNNSRNQYKKNEYKRQLTKKAKKPKNSKLIRGIISEANGPLPGANIVVVGTIRGVSADVDGYYEIEAAEGERLAFSFQGYDSKVCSIGNSKFIDVILKESENTLDEVVVTALGIKKKSSSVTSSNQIAKYDELTQSTSAIEALKGKVSGLQINTNAVGLNGNTKITIRGNSSISENKYALIVIDGVISNASALSNMSSNEILEVSTLKGAQSTALYGSDGINGVIIITTKNAVKELKQVKTRTNLSETAFFFPQLRTDNEGKVNFTFNSPEALTQWKMRVLAHNKNANSGYLEKTVITQKELMIMPNMPRFLREKDTITITAKVSNLTPKAKNGIAILQLFDAATMENIDAKMMNSNAVKNFTILPSGNSTVKWKITIPAGLLGAQYKVIAKADNYSDGEESILPVLTNSILVTESLPIWVRENAKKEYTFENLKNNSSATLHNHLFTLEYTSNPTWLAIQSLPYLMEYEHECAEQTFARYYANVLATEIINSNPKIATLFETWKKSENSISKLEQNEELKSLILAETPWLNDAQNEEEKRKKMALLFDLESMKTTLESTFRKLKSKQNSSGGFAWFDGGEENEYITRHIVAGLGHLQRLKIDAKISNSSSEITKSAIPYLDSKLIKNTKIIEKYYAKNQSADLHYLYGRSFYLDSFPVSKELKIIIDKQLESIKSNWLNFSIYNKAIASLVLNRFKEKEIAKKIIVSLKETSSNNEDWGMYWIENKLGWNWNEAPIETQALLIEAFIEVTNDTKSVDAMKVWLLKNKQTKNWPTTKSTTEAVYALLLQGTDWLSVKDNTIIKIGDAKIATKKLTENEKEAETGYIKMNWKAEEIKPDMATIVIENKSKVPGYGGIYWQYFEDLDKIKTNIGTVLSTSKELYLKKNKENGDELQKINATTELHIGDLVTVRIIIIAKEDMEYVHLKDMRASCFEPINVLSKYDWKNGLGFYMSTKDAATHFFFDQINKGTYILEYDVRVNNSGDFSNGITTIESMYAPEFANHSKGIRVHVKD